MLLISIATFESIFSTLLSFSHKRWYRIALAGFIFCVISTKCVIGSSQDEEERSVHSHAISTPPASQPTPRALLHTVEFSLDYQLPHYPLRDISHIQIVTNTGYSQKIEWDQMKKGVKGYPLPRYPVYSLDEQLQIGVIVISTYRQKPVWEGPIYSCAFPVKDRVVHSLLN